MKGTHLHGLEGTNPLGFLAALGVQVAFAAQQTCPKLWWSKDVIPHAIVDDDYTADCIVERVMDVLPLWENSRAVNPKLDGSAMPRGDELKLSSDNIRIYLDMASDGAAEELSTALVAEGSLDKQGVAKPSDLYFTAGQQKFLYSVRQILSGVSAEDVRAGLLGRWKYDSELPSLGWDVVDDRMYALRALDPSSEKKLTNSGPEALAILGLSTHKVITGRSRTVTRGCSGTWKNSTYSWPIWNRPASFYAVQSLLMHADDKDKNRHGWFHSWGITKILKSRMKRSGQGGYGTFGPPEIVWSAS